jgi:hypothetical protein
MPSTPEEFKNKMMDIKERITFQVEAHESADELLCDLLVSLGYDEGVKIFYSIDKWYA